MKRLIYVACGFIAVSIAGCGSASSAPKPTPTPIASVTPVASATTAIRSTPTASATVDASGTAVTIPTDIAAAFCLEYANDATEVKQLNKEMGSNPSIATMIATLNQLAALSASSASKATGQIKTAFQAISKGARSAGAELKKEKGVLSNSEIKTLLKDEVVGIGADWSVAQGLANCHINP